MGSSVCITGLVLKVKASQPGKVLESQRRTCTENQELQMIRAGDDQNLAMCEGLCRLSSRFL